ncbi:MAG: FAD-linked oxidase C-terminal domain-containing protein, partial [Myxococcota bacterium]|nr:FAD-linked oxidase C-terminal domain-containing protein [Myxococcota bacterium]
TERDVFAGARGLDLMRSIKQRFDPAGILNPGRFAGRI